LTAPCTLGYDTHAMRSNTRNKYGLTVKQERFCHAYVRLGNATEAYRQTYDTTGIASTVQTDADALLNHPRISPRIIKLVDRVTDAEESTTDLILQRLLRESDAEEPTSDVPSARVKALEVLARVRGMLIDRSEVAIAGRIEHVHPEMGNLSESELRALAQMPGDAAPKALTGRG